MTLLIFKAVYWETGGRGGLNFASLKRTEGEGIMYTKENFILSYDLMRYF